MSRTDRTGRGAEQVVIPLGWRAASRSRPGRGHRPVRPWKRLKPAQSAQPAGRGRPQPWRPRDAALRPADEEEAADRRKVFDIGLLAQRLGTAMDFTARHPATAGLPLACSVPAPAPLRRWSQPRRGRRRSAPSSHAAGGPTWPGRRASGRSRADAADRRWRGPRGAGAECRGAQPDDLPERVGGGARRNPSVRGAGALEQVSHLAAAWFQRWLAPEAKDVPV